MVKPQQADCHLLISPVNNTTFSWLVLTNVVATTFLAIFSATLTIIADNSIQGELALSFPQSIWISILYLLGANSIVPAANRLADRYGYHRMYVIGVMIFTLGSGMAGFSFDFISISVARYIEGIGAGLIFPIGLARIAQNFPKEKLSFALNLYIAIGFGGGLGLGMPLSGYFTQFHSWRIPFYIMIPCGILAILACLSSKQETELKPNLKFDLWGLLSFDLFIAALLVALTTGQLPSTAEGWRSPIVLGCFVLSAIGFIAMLFIERRHPAPVVPLKLFQNPLFSLNCLSIYLLGMAIFASLTVSSEYLINALGTEKCITGVICLVYGITLAVSSILASLLMKKVPVIFLTLLGLSGLIASYYWNNILSLQTGWRELIPILMLRGASLGFSLGPTTVQAMSDVPKELKDSAATLLTFFRQVGGTFAGSMITIFLIRRKIFYAARYGEQINSQLPGYKVVFKKLEALTAADPYTMTPAQAERMIINNVELQAYVQGLNDSMLIFAYLTIVVMALLILLNLWQWWKKRSKGISFGI